MSPTTKSSIGSRSRPSHTQRDNTPSAVDVSLVVSNLSVSTALLQEFCQLTVPGHGRGHADRFPTSATRILVVSSAGASECKLHQTSFQAEGIGIRALAVIANDGFPIHGTHISEKSSRRFPCAGSMLCFHRGVSHEVDAQMWLFDRGCWSGGSDEDTSLQSCGDISSFIVDKPTNKVW